MFSQILQTNILSNEHGKCEVTNNGNVVTLVVTNEPNCTTQNSTKPACYVIGQI